MSSKPLIPRSQPGLAKRKRKRYPVEQYDRVQTMLVAMVPYSMIQNQLSKEWGKPKAYVMDVIKQVHEDWAADDAMVAKTRRHQIRNAFETLYMKATQAKDGHLAARVLNELGRLDGVYAPTSQNVNVSGAVVGVGVGMSLGALGFKDPSEVAARIEELRAQIAAQGPGVLAGHVAEPADQLTLPSGPMVDAVAVEVPEKPEE